MEAENDQMDIWLVHNIPLSSWDWMHPDRPDANKGPSKCKPEEFFFFLLFIVAFAVMIGKKKKMLGGNAVFTVYLLGPHHR